MCILQRKADISKAPILDLRPSVAEVVEWVFLTHQSGVWRAACSRSGPFRSGRKVVYIRCGGRSTRIWHERLIRVASRRTTPQGSQPTQGKTSSVILRGQS